MDAKFEHYILYNTATEEWGNDTQMIRMQRTIKNQELADQKSDWRWVPYSDYEEWQKEEARKWGSAAEAERDQLRHG